MIMMIEIRNIFMKQLKINFFDKTSAKRLSSYYTNNVRRKHHRVLSGDMIETNFHNYT